MSLTSITVTGTFVRPDGEPDQGTLTATLTAPMVNGGETVEATPTVGMLDQEGKLIDLAGRPFVLFANDDTGTKPAGTEYEFVLQIDNAPLRTFSAVVPHAASPWSAEDTYGLGQCVEHAGETYRSLKAANTGHEPPGASEWWGAAPGEGQIDLVELEA